MRARSKWVYAAKPDSWSKLLVPFVLGQAMGLEGAFAEGAPLEALGRALTGLAFVVLDLLFIVFVNDWGDREVDAIKRRMFPDGCSPKTIPDGILPARALLLAGLACGGASLVVAALAETLLGRPGLTVAALGCLAIFVAYTLPPLRLNYRGGGELLEMLGVGVALPWLEAYWQGGRAWSEGLALLPAFALLALASAIASGLADERSDRAGGKRTVVTTLGNALSRRLIEALPPLAAVWLVGLAALEGFRGVETVPFWLSLAVAASIAGGLGAVRARSAPAETDAFVAQRLYKAALHGLIHRAALLAAGLLVVRELI